MIYVENTFYLLEVESNFSGFHFWPTVSKMVRPMLLVRCLSVCLSCLTCL